MSLLSCKDLTLNIGGKTVCQNFSLSFESGQCWGILGQNGVGKTTLLHTLANLHSSEQGVVKLRGKDVAHWPRRQFAQTLGVLIQDNHDSFPATVLETTLIGRHPYTPAWRMETDEDVTLAKAALRAVALEDMADRQVDTLSGGERQRLALASILTQAPQVMLLDEPTNHLDLHFQISLLDMFAQHVRKAQGLLVMTLHDINLAARFCDHLILLLGDGEVVYGSTEAMLCEDYLHRLYRHCIVEIESDKGRAFLPG